MERLSVSATDGAASAEAGNARGLGLGGSPDSGGTSSLSPSLACRPRSRRAAEPGAAARATVIFFVLWTAELRRTGRGAGAGVVAGACGRTVARALAATVRAGRRRGLGRRGFPSPPPRCRAAGGLDRPSLGLGSVASVTI